MPKLKAVIVKNIAPLMQKPDRDSELADEVLFGMQVDMLEDKGEWLYIKTQYNYMGYLHKDAVIIDGNNTWEQYDKHFIIAAFADVLSEPRYSAGVIITITRGSCVVLTGEEEGKWTKIILPSGEIGWIRKESLLSRKNESGFALRQDIVDTALLYLGTQYRWGGKSPMGIDCSGLSSMAYMLNGIVIPRDANIQMDSMKKVERRQSKPGDLLFFPGHVAIYIGEDKFVHATGADAVVKINSFNKDSKLYRKDLDEKYICTGTVF
ncbi:MAG: NlpC/P60 family protein [Lutisporaceae bacterium]